MVEKLNPKTGKKTMIPQKDLLPLYQAMQQMPGDKTHMFADHILSGSGRYAISLRPWPSPRTRSRQRARGEGGSLRYADSAVSGKKGAMEEICRHAAAYQDGKPAVFIAAPKNDFVRSRSMNAII